MISTFTSLRFKIPQYGRVTIGTNWPICLVQIASMMTISEMLHMFAII